MAINNTLYENDVLTHGIDTCAGCGMESVARAVLNTIGPNTVLVIPPGCGALLVGLGHNTNFKIPVFMGNLGNAAAVASGLRAALDKKGKQDVNVVCFAGDGATVDIGLQSLSAAFERRDRIFYICYDNEGYQNTGAQGSGSTPNLAKTPTTPQGKPSIRKDVAQIMLAHKPDYLATASAGYIDDLIRKVNKALTKKGPVYFHILSHCPPGWGHETPKGTEVTRMAVQTRIFPLYEVDEGVARWSPRVRKPQPISEYFKLQDRFSSLSEEEVQYYQQMVDEEYYNLARKLGIET